MHENEYAYAVARIRANEVNLLTPAETEQLISAESYEAALRLLGDKGWHTDGVGHDYAPMLEEHVNAAWQLLKESAPDASLLDALVINNDFFNLKAALRPRPVRLCCKTERVGSGRDNRVRRAKRARLPARVHEELRAGGL
mgnify:CR=1 FL=1